jgi:polyhydroxyalkanoate synthesis regulator protein
MEVIKKYPNNKLYIPRGNTEPVGYVTLLDLVTIIRKGKSLKVIDSKSGEDITVKVLKPALEHVDMSVESLMEILRG